MEKAKITFGKTTVKAEKNGTAYITDEPFEYDGSPVTIKEADGSVKTFDSPRLQECAGTDDRYWFAFVEPTEAEKLRADVDYLLCITE